MLTPNATVGAVTVSCNNIITMMEMMTQICRRKSTVTEHKLHDHNLSHKILVLLSAHILFEFISIRNRRHREKFIFIKEEIS